MTDQERLKLSILHLVAQNWGALRVDSPNVAEACELFHAWVTKDTLALPKIDPILYPSGVGVRDGSAV